MLNGVNLDLNQSKFCVFMGPNRSGKSTLSAIMASVIKFDSGTVEMFEVNPAEARKSIGYIPQDNFSIPRSHAMRT